MLFKRNSGCISTFWEHSYQHASRSLEDLAYCKRTWFAQLIEKSSALLFCRAENFSSEQTLTYNDVQSGMANLGYMASDDLAVSIHLALTLGRPLLLEGAAGVGKTEVARVLAEMKGTELVRLQCYEGLDAAQAIYEWNYQKQLLSIRASAEEGPTGQAAEERIFSRDYLLERPLLAAINKEKAPILLIDEVDRADAEFEAYLLEILSD